MTGITAQFDLLHNQLQQTAARHNVASNNIANVNTPGFKALELVSFDNAMNEEAQSQSLRETEAESRLDGNNVDIHQEMGAMKKNELVHNVYTQVLASRIRQLQRAISPG